ncbi:potassium-transporting ATPase subunit C [Ktedonospora formicarum]|uniref:Potassium-transporting ATPase KdpC subunit n=1 Tax=Ktedonospora formicarum TaxID=2778364 RepID=A0A8J3IA30_9CHLR|nr:potassium-transporting ATPase subunit C [Ktedonospora formicarum]GHO48787.1 potassium-transporting ATPase KdpC subunit [Ktedonospora formicarum]
MRQNQEKADVPAQEHAIAPLMPWYHCFSQEGREIIHTSWGALKLFCLLLLVCGILFPALVYVIGQTLFPDQANGSLIYNQQQQVIGSRLIGQQFTRPEYFHGRPSAVGYNAASSSGSNIGPTNPQLIEGNGSIVTLQPGAPVPPNAIPIADKAHTYYLPGTYNGVKAYAEQFRKENNLSPTILLPADIVTASGSGLDPHISVEAARLQINRILTVRHALGGKNTVLSVEELRALIQKHTDERDLGLFGEPRVNVLELNVDLDARYGSSQAKR